MVALPQTDWRTRAGLDELIEALGGGTHARFVGGAVRDALLGLPVADIDIATRHDPEDVMHRLRRAGIKAVPTGIAHGTITAVIASGPVEVTTLRRDVSTDGRHAVVAFTDDWREDAARRDFTMNALYADPDTGEVFDYFGGLADLDARRIRFIGDARQRIAEDHLRILRFFRFLARFGDTPDAAGLAACTDRTNDLMALSRERIRDELLKLLVARDAVAVIRLMLDHGIVAPVLPEIDPAGVARLAALASTEDAQGIAPDAIRRLAALVGHDAVVEVGARLKLSNADRKRLEAAGSGVGDEGPRALAYRVGPDGARDRLLLAGADTHSLDGWVPPRLPVSGGALVARGLRKGPDVARTLRAIEDRWIAAGFPERIDAIVDEAVAQALSAASSA
ncbi:polynucleotide adenylyltransferase [Sphingomonas sp. Leaf33]|uniref:CCA tRNA nucleotidyltransferase n=1 Tax=Sphingomonas sp. Leaf33 TaxID=1736215 RepID=UPI0006FAC8F9|nr:CCA tRNA nucleotidyltransferase [Sphingomonas sp. Leaf33]KQN26408.1 polynucleotide adenylyltransferase [Sphingomonas sp. Leaf33]